VSTELDARAAGLLDRLPRRLHELVDHWARARPEGPALADADGRLDWAATAARSSGWPLNCAPPA